eukprot:TRINITY_DN82300_c0_g1_i1.p1 TRINITY_DN82300_c0_g1~~TRINITY_DN82300_c0_g1_i1.p1  ORF type:complete len:438 (-),score=118.13 TRINITY_DN82300_c0_g1_i1:186-1499(-)
MTKALKQVWRHDDDAFGIVSDEAPNGELQILVPPRPPLGGLMRRPRALAGTSFLHSAFNEVVCKDGFRCVSSTRKFGRKHTQGEDVASAEPSTSSQDPEAEDVYEWNCPYDGLWNPGRYRVGNGADECTNEGKDCICISRSSSDFTSTMKDGKEVVSGEFGADATGTVATPELAKLRQFKIIPHYAMRKLPEGFDTDDPHSDMGQITNMPQSVYLDNINVYAPKMQHTLDEYHKQLEAMYAGKVEGQGSLCGPGSGNAFSLPEAELASGKIRRFQVLSQDCEVMRDNIGKLAPTPELERFDGKFKADELHCFKEEGGKGCKQLNCYNSAADADFRSKLADFRRKLEQCRPETDATEENAEPPPAAPPAAQAALGMAGIVLGIVAPATLAPRQWRSACRQQRRRPAAAESEEASTRLEQCLLAHDTTQAAAMLGGSFL